jgi:hypothetical protein
MLELVSSHPSMEIRPNHCRKTKSSIEKSYKKIPGKGK